MSGIGAPRERRLDPFGDGVRVVVAVRNLHAAFGRDPRIVLDDAEHGERRGIGAARVDRANGPNDVSEDLGALEVVLGDRVALHESRDETGPFGHPDDDLGADSGGGRGASGLDLGLAVDPEQLGVAAREPQDESLVARR